MTATQPSLFTAILDALPQTQCTRCGYPDCEGYAQAIANGTAAINQCPPGGGEGIARLAALTGQPVQALNPEYGAEAPRLVAYIDESWCIGCTLCIEACPTDAIVGSNKQMHTVIEPYCTGCALCIPVCPVDCILTENASGVATGWDAWSGNQANQARERYKQHQTRVQQSKLQRLDGHKRALQDKLSDLPKHSKVQDPALLEKKRIMIEVALERAKARISGPPTG
jgi:electron transport complex protein RnfB